MRIDEIFGPNDDPLAIQIFPSKNGRGAYLRLPPSMDALQAAFKAAFPSATYYSDSRRWYLVGKTAENRLRKWADAQAGSVQDTVDQKRAAAEADAALGKLTTPEVRVVTVSDSFHVTFAYDAAAVAAIRAVPGARWDSGARVWTVPLIERPALRAAIAVMSPILAAAAAAKAQAEQARKQEWDDRLARRREINARRWPMLLDVAPRPGETFRLHGEALTAENLGKTFSVDEDMPSMYPNLLGHEGERVAYVYFRPATPDEAAALAAREQAAKERAARRRWAHAEIRAITNDFDALAERPEHPARPTGEMLLRERPDLAIYGGGVDWLLADDGALWQLHGNGADGDDWALNNLPSTIATRVVGPQASVLADRLRAVATALG